MISEKLNFEILRELSEKSDFHEKAIFLQEVMTKCNKLIATLHKKHNAEYVEEVEIKTTIEESSEEEQPV